MGKSVGVISAGAWGTAIAKVLADNGHQVEMWDFMKQVVTDINTNHRNETFLPGVDLPVNLKATDDILQAAQGKDAVILATPSLYLINIVRELIKVPSIQEGNTIIGILTKGFMKSDHSYALIVDTLEGYLPGFYRGKVVYISGPSHAEEVARGKLTGLISACENGKNSIAMRELLNGKALMVFPSLDVIGVQVAAATKNVIAIAYGVLDALSEHYPGFGDNTESLLLAAGLNEIQSLGKALGSTHPETFTSIAGVGDLDVTCRSKFGRNRRFGRDIVEQHILNRFKDLDDLLANIQSIGYLPEGAVACRAAVQLAKEKGLKLPIMEGVYGILNREMEPIATLRSILGHMDLSEE
jgi:glycerol-3-phosphate dehydrogenase (NAD(P)+)